METNVPHKTKKKGAWGTTGSSYYTGNRERSIGNELNSLFLPI